MRQDHRYNMRPDRLGHPSDRLRLSLSLHPSRDGTLKGGDPFLNASFRMVHRGLQEESAHMSHQVTPHKLRAPMPKSGPGMFVN